MGYVVQAKRVSHGILEKPRKGIDFKLLVERLFREFELEVEVVWAITRVLKNKIVVKGRLRFKNTCNTMYLRTYFYVEQLVSGGINGNIVTTYIKHVSIGGRKAFVTGKIHYLLFTTTKHLYMVSLDIVTNTIKERHPLYVPLYMELYGEHPLYSIRKPTT